jgi:putative ABC transport system ATP-binding protein
MVSSKTENNDKETPFAIQVKHLSKRVHLPDRILEVLDDVSLSVNEGESCAIVGRSGSGKTTLLGILAGLDLPSSGEVFLAGTDITALSEDARAEVRAESVGFVFQSFHLLSHLTAIQNVMLPMELQGIAEPEKRALELLSELGLSERSKHFPQQLSGGEQQRVAIARAFACNPSVLFADEPTGNLDSDTGAEIINLLFKLNAQMGTTLVMVTHDTALAERCDRICRIESGRLVD